MLCGRKKAVNVNLRTQPVIDVEFRLKEESGNYHVLQLSDQPSKDVIQPSKDVDKNLFTYDYKWTIRMEKSEEEKIKEEQRKKENYEEEKKNAELEKNMQRSEKEFAQKVNEQQGLLGKLQLRNDQLQNLFNETKRDYLINAIKNETLKKMIQSDQQEFITYSEYKL